MNAFAWPAEQIDKLEDSIQTKVKIWMLREAAEFVLSRLSTMDDNRPERYTAALETIK